MTARVLQAKAKKEAITKKMLMKMTPRTVTPKKETATMSPKKRAKMMKMTTTSLKRNLNRAHPTKNERPVKPNYRTIAGEHSKRKNNCIVFVNSL